MLQSLILDDSNFQKLLSSGRINRKINNWIRGTQSVKVSSLSGEQVEATVSRATCLHRTQFQVALQVPNAR